MKTLSRIRNEAVHIWKTFLHIIAMNFPNSHIKRFCYRIRGTKLGRDVDISQNVFLEELYPEYITIGDHVDFGPNVLITTHDSSIRCIVPGSDVPVRSVIIENNVYIGAGSIILPGVHIGHHTIIGAGSVVTRDIPPSCVAYGIPAKVHAEVGDYLFKRTGLSYSDDSHIFTGENKIH